MSTTEHNSVTETTGVSVTIDGVEMNVPEGTLIMRAAEEAGIHIPRFCDHPLLKPQASCRQCLVDVGTPDREGNVRTMPKPQPSCAIEVSPGMIVNTQHTSEVAEKAQHGNMEFLLINHPLDCPVCDKGGECPLQNQAMTDGRSTSRFIDAKRTFPKPVKISTQIMLDRDRCILCQRCTRFQEQIAGDPFIDVQGRGGGEAGREVGTMHAQQIGGFDETILAITPRGGEEPLSELHEDSTVGPDGEGAVVSGVVTTVGNAEIDTTGRPFASYFGGNTIQICPVGALTSAAYRFRSRPFDLVSSDSVAEHDACGAAIRVDHRRGTVMRRLSGDDSCVNEEWITDKDRFAFTWQSAPDVLTTPMVRNFETGQLEPTSWSEAIHLAAQGLSKAISAGGVGHLPGGRLTLEDAYGWSKFARVVCGTNDIDFRARAHSAEELDFLASTVAGSAMDVTFTDLENSPMVLLVGFEPEEEAGNIFLRLRKGVLAGRTTVATIAPFATRGTTKMRATLLATDPGREADTLAALAQGDGDDVQAVAAALKESGAIVLLGERLSQSAGGYTAALHLAQATGARLAWVPRRAGDRGAVEAGLLPNLLPGGRPVADADARVDAGAAWGVPSLPGEHGRDLTGIFQAAANGELAGLVLGGVDVHDLPEAQVAIDGAARAFTVQLEVRRSELTEHADVVLPVAPPSRKAGTFLNWEGRPRPFEQVFDSSTRSDAGVLDMVAAAMGTDIGVAAIEDVHAGLAEFAEWDGARTDVPTVAAEKATSGHYVLATWRMMLDSGRCQDGEPHLAGTAHRPVVRVSPATAAKLGVGLDSRLTVTGPGGHITLPVVPTAMPDHVVWLPQHSPGSSVYRMLGVGAGAAVTLSASAEVAQ